MFLPCLCLFSLLKIFVQWQHVVSKPLPVPAVCSQLELKTSAPRVGSSCLQLRSENRQGERSTPVTRNHCAGGAGGGRKMTASSWCCGLRCFCRRTGCLKNISSAPGEAPTSTSRAAGGAGALRSHLCHKIVSPEGAQRRHRLLPRAMTLMRVSARPLPLPGACCSKPPWV